MCGNNIAMKEMSGNCIVLFGAGVYARKFKDMLDYIGFEISYFTDNDNYKWGDALYGKTIIPPSKLPDIPELKIVISCTHETAIKHQLKLSGLQDSLLSQKQLYELCLKKAEAECGDISDLKITQNNAIGFRAEDTANNTVSVRLDETEDAADLIQKDVVNSTAEHNVIIDMYEGIGWGGSELWALNLAQNIDAARVSILGSTEQKKLKPYYEERVHRMEGKETIRNMLEYMKAHMPFTLINNFAGSVFLSASILKSIYPDKVSIISVIHNDSLPLFDSHMLLSEYIDAIFCVSDQIKKHMVDIYDYPPDRYYHMPQPIELPGERQNKADNKKRPLRIGYAGRLVKQQKRVDRFSELISILDGCGIDYEMLIAGEGEESEALKTYLDSRSSKSGRTNVKLLGYLDPEAMPDFWDSIDVYFNISEYEGASLSMMEAMSHGCIPVVTEVSGASEIIENGYNGYLSPVGDLEQLCRNISVLTGDRDRLLSMGNNCRETIRAICNKEKYFAFWNRLIYEVSANGL